MALKLRHLRVRSPSGRDYRLGIEPLEDRRVLDGHLGATDVLDSKLAPMDAGEDEAFGVSVAVEGQTMLIGALADDDASRNRPGTGAAFIFQQIGMRWVAQAKLTASDSDVGDAFGHSVAMDGDTLVIGAPNDDEGGRDTGSVYVFRRDGDTWSEQTKLTANDAARVDKFGSSVAIDGDTVAIGSPRDDDGGASSGSVYVFQRDGDAWSQQAKLKASDADRNDQFGQSVSIHDNTIVVGSHFDGDHGARSGSAYIFQRSGGVWTEQAKLTASDAAEADRFGHSVSIDGPMVVVGAYFGDAAAADSGAAYVFQHNGDRWNEIAKLSAADAAPGDRFGQAVSINGTSVVIGAPQNNDRPGAAYIFKHDGESWSPWTKLVAADADAGDAFGSSVDASSDRVVVGAPDDSDFVDDSGAAYPFGLLSVDGLVWEDADQNGQRDASDRGVAGVTVRLLDSNQSIVARTTTDADGGYRLHDVSMGEYSVQFVASSGTAFSPQDRGVDETFDSDADSATGRTSSFLLTADQSMFFDAGLYATSTETRIGGTVWNDIDNDGMRDVQDVGVAGVTVKLLDLVGTAVATTTSSSDGTYDFVDLSPGTYEIEFAAPPVSIFTAPHVGLDETRDSDADLSGRTGPLGLLVGQTDLSQDAGLKQGLTVKRSDELAISEFLARNENGLTDMDGDSSDWIEIHNVSTGPVDLDGWYLTDDPGDLERWSFPGVELPADDYLIVFASGKNRSLPGDELHTNFQLRGEGEYLALVKPDGATIAHQFAAAYPRQKQDNSYGIFDRGGQLGPILGFFEEPTPGAPNGKVFGAFVAPEVQFSMEHGFYDAPFELMLSTDSPLASIRYTINGAEPTQHDGTLYTGPIPIDGTTTLRAAAYQFGHELSPVKTNTFVFISDVILQQQMDPEVVSDPAYEHMIDDSLKAIGTLSIVMNPADWDGPNGIYQNFRERGTEWERPASAELFFADDRKGFQINSGVRIGPGRDKGPAKGLRLLFKDQYGPAKLEFPLFDGSPVQQFDQLHVRPEQNNSWPIGFAMAQHHRDQFSRDTQIAMGQPSAYGTFHHLYVNGEYWGVFNTFERTNHSWSADHLGGDKQDYDVIKAGTEGDVELNQGSRDAWDQMFALSRAGLAGNSEYQTIQEYLDVEKLIDFMLMVYYTGERDSPVCVCQPDWPHNFWASRSRQPGGRFRFYAFDYEMNLLDVNEDQTRNQGHDNPAEIFHDLLVNDDFRQLLIDRIFLHFFHDGALTPSAAAGRFKARADQLFDAVVADSARWGDETSETPLTRDEHWVTERDRILHEFMPQRTDIVLDQLRGRGWYPRFNPPVFSHPGGTVPSGFQLDMSADGGTIYYTLDGTDPRQSGGESEPGQPAAGAQRFVVQSPLTISESVTVSARTLLDGKWSALAASTFAVPVEGLRVSEIMYHPQDPSAEEQAAGFDNDGDFEFIELVNTSDQSIDLTDVRLTKAIVGNNEEGVAFDFSQASTTLLPPGGAVLVVENAEAFALRYGNNLPVAGEWSGQLSNNQELITVLSVGEIVQQFAYQDDWFPTTDGEGYSLEIIDAAKPDLDSWNEMESWRASEKKKGTPGHAEALESAAGDANRDGSFDQTDISELISAGKFETGEETLWEQGDFNGDGVFNFYDVLVALANGTYNQHTAAGP